MKYYVVLSGRAPGIYNSREECKKQVDSCPCAIYKSFSSKDHASFARKTQTFWLQWKSSSDYLRQVMADDFYRAICTDAACPNNPWPVEWRGVDIETGKEIFSLWPIPYGTVNIAEFLAIVNALQFILDSDGGMSSSKNIIYTDSSVALAWLKKWIVTSSLSLNRQTRQILDMLDLSLSWLVQNRHRWIDKIRVLKRPTALWWQIPADFGRK